MRTRVYLPLTVEDLRALRDVGRLPLDGRRGHAVTSVVRAAFPGDDEEELEYAALWSAAEASGEPRVVAAIDLPPAAVAETGRDGDDAYLVELSGTLSGRELVALHVEEPGAGPDDEMSWYDATELPRVAEVAGGA